MRKIKLSENSRRVLERRYLRKDENGKVVETPEELFRRVALAVAKPDEEYNTSARNAEAFYQMMAKLEFLPNSPTLMNAGTDMGQLSACFVLPVEDDMSSIFNTVKATALIHQSGGGTGFSFSRLRPKGDMVRSTGGVASGPISFMRVFDAATEVIKQGGKRRGANMGILRVDHPDILDFIRCKEQEGVLSNFNISVVIPDAFMKVFEKDGDYPLINPRTGEEIKRLRAKQVFKLITERAWANGEPGIIFIDRMNQFNPTPQLGAYESTNPCGEQILLPWESCNLGSINLSKMLKKKGDSFMLDWDKLESTVKTAVHFMDNVVTVNKFPLPEIQEAALKTRKIGLGVMGFADLLVKLQIPYNSEQAVDKAEEVMDFIQEKGREASVELAEERGAFPNFKGSVFDKPGAKPMRNATVTTIAPTGTISIIADCSSGIEPNFAWKTIRQDSFGEVELLHPLYEEWTKAHPNEALPDYFVTAHEITPEWHVRIQAAFQKYTDNAVSKTVNFPNSATRDDVREAYMLAYKLGCKGVTIYRDGSRDVQVLSVSQRPVKEEGENVKKQEEVAFREPRLRPFITTGKTIKMKTGCGNLYVTINEDEYGLCEVFSTMGKAGGCAASQSEAVSRLISLALRSGISVDAIVGHLEGISCLQPVWHNGQQILSCADALAKAMNIYLGKSDDEVIGQDKTSMPVAGSACPECGGILEKVEGCDVCRFCGFSRC